VENPSNQRKICPSDTLPSPIPHDLPWDLTQASVIRSQQLIVWVMTQPQIMIRPQ